MLFIWDLAMKNSDLYGIQHDSTMNNGDLYGI